MAKLEKHRNCLPVDHTKLVVVGSGRFAKVKPSVVPDDVMTEVVKDFNISPKWLLTKSRKVHKKAVIARGELARRLDVHGYSLRDIGIYLHRNRNAVWRSICRARKLLAKLQSEENNRPVTVEDVTKECTCLCHVTVKNYVTVESHFDQILKEEKVT
jgi:hypothetical protein